MAGASGSTGATTRTAGVAGVAGVVVLVAVTLAGCGGGADDPGAGAAPVTFSASTAASSEASTAAAGPSPAGEVLLPDLDQFSPPPSGVLGEVDEDTGQPVQVQPVPSWDEPSRAGAVAAAEAAMRAFARPDLAEEVWWDGVEPLLSAEAARSYAYVDPASIPATGLTDAATLVEQTSAYVARVQVPTDAGTYLLILSRTDATAPWLVERFDPPAEDG